MTRLTLAQRRSSETFTLPWASDRVHFSVSRFRDGRPAEVFINAGKTGSDLHAVARDSAVVVSLALQHGCPIATLRRSITRNSDDAPSSLLGAILDMLAGEPPE